VPPPSVAVAAKATPPSCKPSNAALGTEAGDFPSDDVILGSSEEEGKGGLPDDRAAALTNVARRVRA
jgi:hypothetical protein